MTICSVRNDNLLSRCVYSDILNRKFPPKKPFRRENSDCEECVTFSLPRIKFNFNNSNRKQDLFPFYMPWRHQNKQTIESCVRLLSWGISAPKHLSLYKFSVRKCSLFCDKGRLNFQAFVWRGIWLAAGKALMWVKDVLRFCYLNIPCLRINSTLIFMSSSNDEVAYFEENSKTDGIAQAPCFGKGWKNREETGSRGDVFGVRTSTPVENHFKKWVILIALQFRYTFYKTQTKRLRTRKIGFSLPIALLVIACSRWRQGLLFGRGPNRVMETACFDANVH